MKGPTGTVIAGAEVALETPWTPGATKSSRSTTTSSSGETVTETSSESSTERSTETATSDSAGVARLSTRPSMRTLVWVAAEGYQATTAPVSSPGVLDVTLREGVSFDGIVVERRGDRRSSYPELRFVDHGVADVAVEAIVLSPEQGPVVVEEARTDAAGRFHVRGVALSKLGYVSCHLRASQLSTGREEESGVLVGKDGPLLPVRIELPGDGRVRVRVVDADGRRAVGASVRVALWRPPSPQEPHGGFDSASASLRLAASGGTRTENGETILDGLARDVDFVVVAVSGAKATPDRPFYATGVSAPFHVAPDAPEVSVGVRIPNPGGAAVTLVDDHRRSILEADVRAERDGVVVPAGPADGHGVFHIAGLGPGSWSFRAKSPSIHETTLVAEVAEGTEASVRVEVRSGARLAGVVTDKSGKPLAKCDLEILAREVGPDAPWKIVRTTTTDENGRYDVALLPDGPLVVRAAGAGFSTVGGGVAVEGSSASLRVEVTAMGRARLALSTADGKPLPTYAEVTRGPLDGSKKPMTTGVPIERGVLTVEYLDGTEEQVVVDVAGYAPIVRTVKAGPGDDVDLGSAVLRRGLRVEGVVVDSAGRGLAHARVLAAGGRADVTTDGSGRFVLEGLPEGPVDVSVDAEGYLEGEARAVVGASTPALRVVLERSGVLVGVVNDAEGKPAGAVRVVVTPLDSGLDAKVPVDDRAMRTDDDGSFKMSLPPGRYRVECQEKEGAEATLLGDVSVGEGEGRPTTFVLRR